jgi:guanine nucleotide-binding protein subunit alpha, other
VLLVLAVVQHITNVPLCATGAGESGKSTIVKQMRIIHHGGFDERERRSWKNIIFHNLIDAFLEILELMKNQHTLLEDSENVVRIC